MIEVGLRLGVHGSAAEGSDHPRPVVSTVLRRLSATALPHCRYMPMALNIIDVVSKSECARSIPKREKNGKMPQPADKISTFTVDHASIENDINSLPCNLQMAMPPETADASRKHLHSTLKYR